MRLQVKGTKKLDRLAKKLEEKGNARSIKYRLGKVIREEAAPALHEQRANLATFMPKRGGLASELATEGRYSIRAKYAGQVSVTIVDSWQGHDMKAIDEGRIRHPLFGNRHHWYSQTVPAGLLTEPVERRRKSITRGIIREMDRLATEIAREV